MEQRSWSREHGDLKGFFITGTDTDVGKTIITSALIMVAMSLGLRACGIKPIETGCIKTKLKVKSQKSEIKDKNLIPSDGIFLKNIAGMDEPIDFITPIRFENPIAPLPASEIEGIFVNINKIKRAFMRLTKKYNAIFVEGIGGLLVPIKKDYSVLDLIKDFDLPVIVVSRPGLGTINHTLLTVNYALKEGLTVAGIIINNAQSSEKSLAEKTNPQIISQLSPVPLLGIFPYLKELKADNIKNSAMENLDIERLKNYLF